MNNKIRYVKEVRIVKDSEERDLVAVKVKGLINIKKLIAPVLVPLEYREEPADGLFELDCIMNEVHDDFIDVELDVEVIFRINDVPKWVKGFKINAAENSDIELL